MPRRFLLIRSLPSASSTNLDGARAILMPHHAISLCSAAFLLWQKNNNCLDLHAAEHILMRTTIDLEDLYANDVRLAGVV
jgi:hypothetical protein